MPYPSLDGFVYEAEERHNVQFGIAGIPICIARAVVVQWIDETEADLRTLIEQDFGPQTGPLTDIGVLDWMHYQARLIPRRPRAITISHEVAAQLRNYPAIEQVKTELERGRDVSPWLSDRVRKRKEDAFADLMFNDWQISHFHLGSRFVAPNKVERTDDLLFALIKADRAVFLAVKPHQRETYTAQEILRSLLRTSPQDLLEWKGAIPRQGHSGWSDAELLELRREGVAYSILIDGRLFSPPGLGVSTSKHAGRIVVRQFNPLSKAIQSVMRHRPPQPRIGFPARLGIKLRSDGCLVLHEKNSAIDLLAMPAFE
jgi:hypothetical protein